MKRRTKKAIAAFTIIVLLLGVGGSKMGIAQTAPDPHAQHKDAAKDPARDTPPSPESSALADQLAKLTDKVNELQSILDKQGGNPRQGSMPGMNADPAAGMKKSARSPKMGSGQMNSGNSMQMGKGGSGGNMPGMPGSGGGTGMQDMDMMGMMNQMMGMMGQMMGKMDQMGGMSGSGDGMSMMDDMDMPMDNMPGASSSGMDMMGMMGGMGGSGMQASPSALPGFPGASHIYHMGATDFFLDHATHITLTTDQKSALEQIKQDALMEQGTFDRQIDEKEQDLWKLTASDQPEIQQIEAKVRELEKLYGEQRVAFIRAVGKAATILNDAQRKSLLGTAPPNPDPAASGMSGMQDM